MCFLFITSCLISTTVADLDRASLNNLSIVTLINEQYTSIVLSILAPMIVFNAIMSSFIGCYIGSKEALRYLFRNFFKNICHIQVKDQYISMLSIYQIFIVLRLCTICNFKILNIIGILVAPAVAFLLYILPVIVIYKCKQYRRVVF